MTTRIEHQAALARIEEMRRYADARRGVRRASGRHGSERRTRGVLATARRRLRLA
jgi:hypothetical protein